MPPVLHEYKDSAGVHRQQWLRQVSLPERAMTVPLRELEQARTLAVRRDMGIGDLLMLTPVFRELRGKFPQLDIDLFCIEPLKSLFWGNPHLRGVYDMDLYPEGGNEHYDLCVDLVRYPERSPLGGSVPRMDIFASVFGLQLTDHTPLYFPEDHEGDEVRKYLEKLPRPWVVVAPLATDRRRAWDLVELQNFSDLAVEHGWSVIVTHQNDALWVMDCFRQPRCFGFWNKSIRQLGALVDLADAVVSVDTGVYHIAAAVPSKPPVITLFGAVDPTLRTAGYSNCRALYHPQSCPKAPCETTLPGCRPIPNDAFVCMKAHTGMSVFTELQKTLGGANADY